MSLLPRTMPALSLSRLLLCRSAISKTTSSCSNPQIASGFLPSSSPTLVDRPSFLVLRRFCSTDGNSDTTPEKEERERPSFKQDEEFDPMDRTREIPLEIGLRYLESDAYFQTYGSSRVWELYRRNFSKGRTWKPTRKTCVRWGKLQTGNPCPICRDQYLVVDYRNTKLLNQFLRDYNGEILSSYTTGVCQRQHKKIVLEMERAKHHGFLDLDPPFIKYDYDAYRSSS